MKDEKITTIEELKEVLGETELDYIEPLLKEYSVENVIKIMTNYCYTVHHDCYSLEDVAEEIITEIYNIPDFMTPYIEWEELADLLSLDVKFIDLGDGRFLEVNY